MTTAAIRPTDDFVRLLEAHLEKVASGGVDPDEYAPRLAAILLAHTFNVPVAE